MNLITQARFPARPMEGQAASAERPRLNFMVDVPRLTGGLDFNKLSLTPAQWKVVSRVDGVSNLEEVRLLAGLTPQEAEKVIYELVDAALIEVRGRGGR